MAHTFTVSTTAKLHEEFKKVVYARGSNISEAICQYMQSEIDGTEEEFRKLKRSVDDLLDRVGTLEGSEHEKEEWHE